MKEDFFIDKDAKQHGGVFRLSEDGTLIICQVSEADYRIIDCFTRDDAWVEVPVNFPDIPKK